MKTRFFGMTFLSLMIWAPAAQAADAQAADAQAVLGEIDKAINRWTDQFLSYEMIDSKPGKSERRLRLNVYMKGEKRMTEFTAPGDVAGTRILILSDSKMYAYLPAYKKVRRIASHVTAQGFMGTTYSNDDLAVTTYADKYVAKMVEENDKQWVLELEAKGDTDVPYPKIRLTAEKKRKLPTRFEYFNEEGKHLKTETRAKYACQNNICAPRKITMEDHTSKGHVSTLVNRDWKVNSGLSDRIFSRRYIQRGR